MHFNSTFRNVTLDESRNDIVIFGDEETWMSQENSSLNLLASRRLGTFLLLLETRYFLFLMLLSLSARITFIPSKHRFRSISISSRDSPPSHYAYVCLCLSALSSLPPFPSIDLFRGLLLWAICPLSAFALTALPDFLLIPPSEEEYFSPTSEYFRSKIER